MTVSLAAAAMLWNSLLDPNIGMVNGILKKLRTAAATFPAQRQHRALVDRRHRAVEGRRLLDDVPDRWVAEYPGRASTKPLGIDGATRFRQFVHITLPMLKRVLLFVLVADTALNFLLFAPVYLITAGGPSGSTDLLMYRTYKSAYINLDTGTALATSTIVLIIIGIIAAAEFRLMRVQE